MSITGLKVFDTTLQKTNSWLKDLMLLMDWEDRHRAFGALRVTLHALRDRLGVVEVAQLSAQLPMLIRGAYFEGWDPTGKPERIRHKEQFLAQIDEYFMNDNNIDSEKVVRAVFNVMTQHLSPGEIKDIKQILPEPIRSLWPSKNGSSIAA